MARPDAAGNNSSTNAHLLPVGTPLSVRTDTTSPLRRGQVIRGSLIYQVFSDNRLALPTGTFLEGTVIDLEPDRHHRLESGLRGDFTPFHTPTISFTRLILADGSAIPVSTKLAMNGAPLFSLVPPPPQTGGFVHQQYAMVKQMAKDRIAVVTGPDKRDRLVQYLYTQLPYHPQRIAKGTAWTVETTQPILLSTSPSKTENSQDAYNSASQKAVTAAAVKRFDQAPWIINANLKESLSSINTAQGTVIHATVMEPIHFSDGTLAVPQGAVLEGAVTQARPARRFGRSGILRFDFRQLQFPDQAVAQNVQTSIQGIDALGGKNLALDFEGRAKPKPQDKVVVPLILFALASRPLDRDGGGDSFGKNAVASNSLGLAGFLVGTAGGWRNVASGIGYYGTALSVYNRWIKRGEEISFARDTRILVETTARRSTPLRTSPHMTESH